MRLHPAGVPERPRVEAASHQNPSASSKTRILCRGAVSACAQLNRPEAAREDSTRKIVRGVVQIGQRTEEPGRTSGWLTGRSPRADDRTLA